MSRFPDVGEIVFCAILLSFEEKFSIELSSISKSVRFSLHSFLKRSLSASCRRGCLMAKNGLSVNMIGKW